MVKIYPKLWYIVNETRENNLSYLCYYETTQSGEVASNVKKMQETGRSWARANDKDSSGNIIDNIPTKNIYVGSSVSRWSTSNKLFRVTDPRGFTVEIPTDNLATLLHHTTVIKGVVQEECVWGKDGNNHILLPVNSEPYRLSKEQQNTLDNKLIPVSDLKVYDWVNFFGGVTEYCFLGRVKITWRVRGYRPKYRYSWNRGNQTEDEYSDWYEIEDDKYVNLFVRNSASQDGMYYADIPTKPKVVKVLRNESIEVVLKDVGWLHAPTRVSNKLDGFIDTNYYSRTDSEIVSIKHKP